jgi:hypothetical protein
VICLPCRTAADARAPRDQHCNTVPGPGAACDCQHRTDRYQPQPEDDLTAFHTLWEQHLGRVYRVMVDATCLPPAACRCGGQRFAGQVVHNSGCLWKNDPAPLRAVAEQALAEQPSGTGIRGLLEHVGIDTTGRDITVGGRVVEAAPRCDATVATPLYLGDPVTCTQPVGHYDPDVKPTFDADGWTSDPGGWHWGGGRTPVWTDADHGATPHTDTTED